MFTEQLIEAQSRIYQKKRKIVLQITDLQITKLCRMHVREQRRMYNVLT